MKQVGEDPCRVIISKPFYIYISMFLITEFAGRVLCHTFRGPFFGSGSLGIQIFICIQYLCVVGENFDFPCCLDGKLSLHVFEMSLVEQGNLARLRTSCLISV